MVFDCEKLFYNLSAKFKGIGKGKPKTLNLLKYSPATLIGTPVQYLCAFMQKYTDSQPCGSSTIYKVMQVKVIFISNTEEKTDDWKKSSTD